MFEVGDKIIVKSLNNEIGVIKASYPEVNSYVVQCGDICSKVSGFNVDLYKEPETKTVTEAEYMKATGEIIEKYNCMNMTGIALASICAFSELRKKLFEVTND